MVKGLKWVLVEICNGLGVEPVFDAVEGSVGFFVGMGPGKGGADLGGEAWNLGHAGRSGEVRGLVVVESQFVFVYEIVEIAVGAVGSSYLMAVKATKRIVESEDHGVLESPKDLIEILLIMNKTAPDPIQTGSVLMKTLTKFHLIFTVDLFTVNSNPHPKKIPVSFQAHYSHARIYISSHNCSTP